MCVSAGRPPGVHPLVLGWEWAGVVDAAKRLSKGVVPSRPRCAGRQLLHALANTRHFLPFSRVAIRRMTRVFH